MKVNVGCGPHTSPEWVNIDTSHKARLAKHPRVADILHRLGVISEHDWEAAHEWSDDILVHDITDKLPFDDASVEYLYSSHMLEHIPRYDALEFVRECHRVLEDDGWIRIVVPDLRELAERYVAGDTKFFANEEGPIADRFMQRNMFHDFHEWGYDAESLAALLAEGGFDQSAIHHRTYREGEVPNLDTIETHEPPKSVYVEAQK